MNRGAAKCAVIEFEASFVTGSKWVVDGGWSVKVGGRSFAKRRKDEA